jgi:hypothetical protein
MGSSDKVRIGCCRVRSFFSYSHYTLNEILEICIFKAFACKSLKLTILHSKEIFEDSKISLINFYDLVIFSRK